MSKVTEQTKLSSL